jgi:hypothetical protein
MRKPTLLLAQLIVAYSGETEQSERSDAGVYFTPKMLRGSIKTWKVTVKVPVQSVMMHRPAG